MAIAYCKMDFVVLEFFSLAITDFIHMTKMDQILSDPTDIADIEDDNDNFDINNLLPPVLEAQANTTGPVVTHQDVCKVLTEKKAMLLSVIMKVEKDPDVAQEILSVTAIQALTYAGSQFKGDAALSSYISAIAYNAACQHARKSVVRKQKAGIYFDHERITDPTLDPALLVADESVNVAEAYSVKQQLQLAEKILKNLEKKYPDAYKTWEMYKLQELSYEEISEKLGISNATARGHVHRISTALSEAHEKLTA